MREYLSFKSESRYDMMMLAQIRLAPNRYHALLHTNLKMEEMIMAHVLENEFLTVEINDHGAELCRIYDKERDQEDLWYADPAFWARHAPVLFPNVGKNYNGYFTYNGVQYPTKQHGFARDSEFQVVDQSEHSITHEFVSSGETLKKYPFSFVFRVTHVLEGRDLKICWYVKNTSDTAMYYTIGGHPAFRVPVLPGTKQSDYFLAFKTEDPTYLLLDTKSGTAINDTFYTLKTVDGKAPIVDGMFETDALVFDHQIEWAAITYPDGTPFVSVTCPGFPNFGIWAAKGGAPFVCLEPWDGRCDNVGFAGEISEKEGIVKLEPNGEYHKSYTITIH